jgi:CubicO group peptidase (beta-lactamase class C family)
MAGLVYPTSDGPRITLRDLLTHNGGLPHDAPAIVPARAPTDADYLKSLAGLELVAPPESGFLYSNLGFELAGAAVSRASGEPYATFLTRHVLAPLGMASTSFDPPKDRVAVGHETRDGKLTETAPELLGEDAAGGLYSSVNDMARWAAFQLEAWPPRAGADAGPLKRSSVREAQRIAAWREMRASSRALGKEASARAIGYGLGWITEETCEWDAAVWHNGSQDGYRSFLMLLPDRGVALVALENVWEPRYLIDEEVREGMHLLDKAGVLPKREWMPTPAELAARDAVLSLRDRWDDALAARTFGRGVENDFMARFKTSLAASVTEHGACKISKTTADGAGHVEGELACERGTVTLRVDLDGERRIAEIHHDDYFPPDPRLAKAAGPLASLVAKWDDKAMKGLLAPELDRAKLREAFAEAGAEHTSCKPDRVDPRSDETHARFVLTCTRGGPLEVRANLEQKTGTVTKVTLTTPAAPGQKCR